MSTTEKETKVRLLAEIVDALDVVESELTFQVKRLIEHVKPRTEAEAQYFEELKAGYQSAAYMVRTLKRYQEGRLERQKGGAVGQSDGFDHVDAFDGDTGAATPYIDDTGSPA